MRYCSFFLVFFGFCTTLFSQSLEGIVLNEYDEAVISVNIVNLSNNKHAHSDIEGKFELTKTQVGDTLQFSHLYFETKNFVVKSLDEKISINLIPTKISLDEIIITNELNALSVISDVDVKLNPVNSSQEILRKVPGLFIGQHAGGGKAEQFFLRGFDIDHGTDINLKIDGLPVNMVSHAHGQGYSDLHFLIPETIDKIDFGKGPYFSDEGNFATAGFVEFQTKEELESSKIKVEAGQFNTQRLLGLFDLWRNEDQSFYFASEYLASDGPFESPQNFSRLNLFGKYSSFINKTDKLNIIASYFNSTWDASGQIPNRAVESGQIGRFGAIDDTEGGITGRVNMQIKYDKILNDESSIKNSIYFTQYDFELYSNFTFFLEDPINGDQIKQKENRNIFGLNSEYYRTFSSDQLDGTFVAGVGLRNDIINDNELSRTANRREILERIQFGNVNETNTSAYLDLKLNYKKWTFNPSFRLDHIDYVYNDLLQSFYSIQSIQKSRISPKLNVLYNQSNNLQFYAKSGIGFHSNDARVVLLQNATDILPAAYGFDLGSIWKANSKMFLNVAYWYLFSEQEFVYVGDAGIVEPSGETKRVGIDLGFKYQPIAPIFINLDINYAHARSVNEMEGQNFIPLAPDLTIVSSFNYKHHTGIYGSASFRLLKDRPANETNSIVAEGYSVIDINAGYKLGRLDFGVKIQNLLDTDWNETQFATESKLQNEIEPIEEIHFTPGTPFFVQSFVQYSF